MSPADQEREIGLPELAELTRQENAKRLPNGLLRSITPWSADDSKKDATNPLPD